MKSLATLASITALVGLSACATPAIKRVTAEAPATVLDAYKPRAYPTDAEIQLAVHAQGLSTTQADALGEFASEWDVDQGGVITLRAPDGGPNAGAAFRTAEGARAFLIRQGVPQDQIVITGYDARGLADPNLLMTYTHYKADIPACGKVWTNLANTMVNEPNSNFGCAVSANISAQLANPGDLVRPRASTPADAGRRLTVLDLYRKGEMTSSAKDENAKGTLSNAVQ
ncbi:MAG: pilus assembly protein CpaD [Alphaproteobacteria bacterium PA2]|nr:MAG: pilus assembly protein CpaD [Alphaproteobacteria bacterium PA2]